MCDISLVWVWVFVGGCLLLMLVLVLVLVLVRLFRGLVEESLGQPVDTVFRSFEDQPLGAASIGQVHRVTLKDGRDAVVKVRTTLIMRLRLVSRIDVFFHCHLVVFTCSHVAVDRCSCFPV